MHRSTTRLLAGYAVATVLVVGLTAGEASALGTLPSLTSGTPTTVEQVPRPTIAEPARPKARTNPASRPPVKPQPTKPQPTKPRPTKPQPTKKTTAPRRPARRPAALPTTLQVAQSQVGGPQTRYTTEWSFGPGFWCAKFVSWVLAHAGVPIRADGPKDLASLVPPVTEPQPGDLAFIDLFPGREGAGITHVGIVESVEPDGSVRTIEGNTASSATVAHAVRRGPEILGFGRPPAPTSTRVIPAPPPTPCEWIEMGKPWMCDWN